MALKTWLYLPGDYPGIANVGQSIILLQLGHLISIVRLYLVGIPSGTYTLNQRRLQNGHLTSAFNIVTGFSSSVKLGSVDLSDELAPGMMARLHIAVFGNPLVTLYR